MYDDLVFLENLTEFCEKLKNSEGSLLDKMKKVLHFWSVEYWL
jgi:hypothetical protein